MFYVFLLVNNILIYSLCIIFFYNLCILLFKKYTTLSQHTHIFSWFCPFEPIIVLLFYVNSVNSDFPFSNPNCRNRIQFEPNSKNSASSKMPDPRLIILLTLTYWFHCSLSLCECISFMFCLMILSFFELLNLFCYCET